MMPLRWRLQTAEQHRNTAEETSTTDEPRTDTMLVAPRREPCCALVSIIVRKLKKNDLSIGLTGLNWPENDDTEAFGITFPTTESRSHGRLRMCKAQFGDRCCVPILRRWTKASRVTLGLPRGIRQQKTFKRTGRCGLASEAETAVSPPARTRSLPTSACGSVRHGRKRH